jgi:cytochrome c oxidase cbb3-type subunit 4
MQDTFNYLSQFAQSWALAGMSLFFLVAVLWAFRPGSSQVYDEVARSILRDDAQPPAGKSAAGPDRRDAAKGA